MFQERDHANEAGYDDRHPNNIVSNPTHFSISAAIRWCARSIGMFVDHSIITPSHESGSLPVAPEFLS
jgi:hypothetical protein